MNSIIIKSLSILLVVLVLALFLPNYFRYRADMRKARERIGAGSKIIQTGSGPLEYADLGEGQPVLVIHGAGGGFDQGILIAEKVLGRHFRFISPSRFGFLRTPMPQDGSFAAMADAYADLLDQLKIKRAAIIGISAGGPSTLQFALRHPDRISALVLFSAVTQPERPMDFRDKIVHYGIFKSDFLFWLITRYFESGLVTFLGVSPEVQARINPEEKRWISEKMIPQIFPISLRQAGMVNDRINFTAIDKRLDQVKVPAMVIYAMDDLLASPSHGKAAARNIPGAEEIVLENGGHMILGHPELGEVLREFLRKNN